MKRAWSILKWILIAWGILCFVGAILAGIFVAYKLGPGNTDSSRTVSKTDVRYVLNWCRLGEDRIEEVVHSYVSARSFTGDHLDAHAIRVSRVDATELKKDDHGGGWTRCDQAEGVLSDALGFVAGWLPDGHIPWFLAPDELRSADIYVYPWSIYCHGTKPDAVELIFVRPKDKRVFYFGSKI